MSVKVIHSFVSTKSEQADPSLIGPNEWNAQHTVTDSSNINLNVDYNFTPQSPGGSLVIGSNTVILNPILKGIAVGSPLYVSGGTGTAESVQVTGWNSTTGQVIITCTNTHSGAWTIGSATGGIQEAINSLPSVVGLVRVVTNSTLYANVTGPAGNNLTVERMPGITISGAFTIFTAPPANNPITNEFFHNPPNYGTNFGISDAVRHVTGNYPINNEFQNEVTNTVQGLVGSVDGPVGFPNGAVIGVGGYAKSESQNVNAVGLFSQGSCGANNNGVWGANVVANNYMGLSGPGFVTNVWGIEIDLNFSSSGSPPANAVGLDVVSNASQVPSTQYDGISLSRPTISQQQFKLGYHSNDGAVSGAAFYAGATHETNSNVNSQTLKFKMRDAGGITHEATIYFASSDYLYQQANGFLFVNESGGSVYMNLNGSNITLLALPVYANNAAAVTGGLTVGMLYKTSTGQVMQVY